MTSELIPISGPAAWLPLPVTVMSKKFAPAIAGPGRTPTFPGAS